MAPDYPKTCNYSLFCLNDGAKIQSSGHYLHIYVYMYILLKIHFLKNSHLACCPKCPGSIWLFVIQRFFFCLIDGTRNLNPEIKSSGDYFNLCS